MEPNSTILLTAADFKNGQFTVSESRDSVLFANGQTIKLDGMQDFSPLFNGNDMAIKNNECVAFAELSKEDRKVATRIAVKEVIPAYVEDEKGNFAITEAKGFAQNLALADEDQLRKFKELITKVSSSNVRTSTLGIGIGSKLLDKQLTTLTNTTISNQLMELNGKINELSPKKNLKEGVLGALAKWVPFVGTNIKNYVEGFTTAKDVLINLSTELQDGKKQIEQDNEDMRQIMADMRKTKSALQQDVQNLGEVVLYLPEYLKQNSLNVNPQIMVEVEFELKQRTQDLMAHLSVIDQTLLSMDQTIDNNGKLAKGIERVSTTTLSALSSAITLSVALDTQKRTVATLTAIKQTTEDLIMHNASTLKENMVSIHKQATETVISPEILEQSLNSIVEAIKEVHSEKAKAIPIMTANIKKLQDLTAKSDAHLIAVEQSKAVLSGKEIKLDTDGKPKIGM